ncbi:MAG: hypothetical protein ABIP95_14375 [Pelobium sp.]
MEISISLSLVLGAFLSVLLGVIAWFIRQLHQDFRQVQQQVSLLQQTAKVIQTESRSAYELLKLRINFLDWRIGGQSSNVEQFKTADYEKSK